MGQVTEKYFSISILTTLYFIITGRGGGDKIHKYWSHKNFTL